MVGFARLVTDYVTFAYLTDLYVLPEHGGRGLGSWLTRCVKQWVDEVSTLRNFVLVTTTGAKEDYYARVFGTGRMGEQTAQRKVVVNAYGRGAVSS